MFWKKLLGIEEKAQPEELSQFDYSSLSSGILAKGSNSKDTTPSAGLTKRPTQDSTDPTFKAAPTYQSNKANAIIENFKNEFLSEIYIQAFPPAIAEAYKALIQSKAQDALNLINHPASTAKEVASHFLTPIILHYLAQNGYLEKLLNETKEMVSIDSFGDYDYSKQDKFLTAFVKPRMTAFITLSKNIEINPRFKDIIDNISVFSEQTDQGLVKLNYLMFFHHPNYDDKFIVELIVNKLSWSLSLLDYFIAGINDEKNHSFELATPELKRIVLNAYNILTSEKTKSLFKPEAAGILANDIAKTIKENSSKCNESEQILALISTGLEMQKTALLKYLDDNKYLTPLKIKRDQLLYLDEYGDLVVDDFKAEVISFCSKRITSIKEQCDKTIESLFPEFLETINGAVITGSDQSYQAPKILYRDQDDALREMVDGIISLLLGLEDELNTNSEVEFDHNFTPVEYELFVACILSEELGWSAKTTKASGDQGADVLAEKENIKLAIQCKLYSSPVGNKAIQEAHAAKSFYKANYAVVVTNSSYTKSALQLAENLGVFTIHHEQLADLDSELFH